MAVFSPQARDGSMMEPSKERNDEKPSMLIRFGTKSVKSPKKQVTYQHARSKFDLGRLLCQVVLVDTFTGSALAALGGTLVWPVVRP